MTLILPAVGWLVLSRPATRHLPILQQVFESPSGADLLCARGGVPDLVQGYLWVMHAHRSAGPPAGRAPGCIC